MIEEIESAPTGIQVQRGFWHELLAAGMIVLLVWLGVEGFVRTYVKAWAVRENVVDIQTPSVFCEKINLMRRHKGLKIALIGDSVILGLSLRDQGDPFWKEQSIAGILERKLTQSFAGSDVLVMNLGINGALPADLAEVGRLLDAARPDLIVSDIGLRGFSADFSQSGQTRTRDWLERIRVDSRGNLYETAPFWSERLEANWRTVARRHWEGYSLRDTLQAVFLGGSPRQFCESGRDKLVNGLNGGPSASQAELAELGLLMKAASRFSTVNLDPGNKQRQALESLLKIAQNRSDKLLLFYSRENPSVRDSLIDRDTYELRRAELKGIIEPFRSSTIRYHEGPEALAEKHYIDHVHLNGEGNAILVDALWNDIEALVFSARAAR